METLKGSCHCGEVRYEVGSDFPVVVECNCSICRRKGTILAFVAEEKFRLISGSEALTNYQFGRKGIEHLFCKNCGVTPFLSGVNRRGDRILAVNVRCLDEVDLEGLDIKKVDGKSF